MNITLRVIAFLARACAQMGADSISYGHSYQPVLPKELI